MKSFFKVLGLVLLFGAAIAFTVWDFIYEVRLQAMVWGVEESRVWALNGAALVIILVGLIIYLIREDGRDE